MKLSSSKSVALICVLLISLNVWAQIDDNTQAILKNMERKYEEIKSMRVRFTIKSVNLQNNATQSESGWALIKKEKYYINFSSTESYFNGTDLYTFLPEEEEVTITKPEGDSENIFNIESVFQLYKKGHKGEYLGEAKRNGRMNYSVRLYPEDLNEDYKFLTAEIDKYTLLPYSLTYSQKDGMNVSIYLDEIKTGVRTKASDFQFNLRKYPDVEVVDMREQ